MSFEKDKLFLEQKYITEKEYQHVLSNDGCYITFYECEDDVVTIHQSSEEKDDYICIDLLDLEILISQIKSKI